MAQIVRKWSYRFFDVDVDKEDETMQDFNELGADGWELVGLRQMRPTGFRESYQAIVRYYFKKLVEVGTIEVEVEVKPKPTKRMKKA